MTKKPKRITIHEEEEIDISGDIESIISELSEYLNDGWTGLQAGIDYEPYDGTPYPHIYLTRSRPETDEEYEKRIKLEQKKKDVVKERELKELKRLKKNTVKLL